MKNLLIFLKVLLVFICVSCKNSEIEENIYTSKDEISEVGDSIFFSSGFSDIKYYKDKLFVSEVKSDRVLIMLTDNQSGEADLSLFGVKINLFESTFAQSEGTYGSYEKGKQNATRLCPGWPPKQYEIYCTGTTGYCAPQKCP